jgi:ribosomal protein S18 acetylase RimI-like enzyme
MASAFAADPLFVATFGRNKAKVRAFLSFMLDMNRLLGGLTKGAFEGDKLAGCMLVEAPEPPPSVRTIARMVLVLARFLPLALRLSPAKILMLNTYVARTRTTPPTGNFAYLSMVGVDPSHQGRGIGRMLTEQALRQATIWNADGLALDTENPTNVRFYEKLGFRLSERLDLGAFVSFCMYRATRP